MGLHANFAIAIKKSRLMRAVPSIHRIQMLALLFIGVFVYVLNVRITGDVAFGFSVVLKWGNWARIREKELGWDWNLEGIRTGCFIPKTLTFRVIGVIG